jgi:predicted TIM-barrel fold metal-dependent hydrolase
MLELVQDYFAAFSAAEQEAIFGGNAVRFYKIDT